MGTGYVEMEDVDNDKFYQARQKDYPGDWGNPIKGSAVNRSNTAHHWRECCEHGRGRNVNDTGWSCGECNMGTTQSLPEIMILLAEHGIATAEQLRERLEVRLGKRIDRLQARCVDAEQRAEKAERELAGLRSTITSQQGTIRKLTRLARVELKPSAAAAAPAYQHGPVIRCDSGNDE